MKMFKKCIRVSGFVAFIFICVMAFFYALTVFVNLIIREIETPTHPQATFCIYQNIFEDTYMIRFCDSKEPVIMASFKTLEEAKKTVDKLKERYNKAIYQK